MASNIAQLVGYFACISKNFFLWWFIVACILGGCAASKIFVPYPALVKPQQDQISQGAEVTIAAKQRGRWRSDSLLFHLEQGRLAQITQQDASSMMHYRNAIELFEQQEYSALIDLSDTGKQGASLLTNDNVIDYRGEFYERSFLHLYQSLNFLNQLDLTAATVEVRRLDAVQRQSLAAHEKLILKAEAEADQKVQQLPVMMDLADQPEAQAQFIAMDQRAAAVKSSVQNAYAYYISGLVYELQGELNDAYIDYRKALELAPQNVYLQTDVLRLGCLLSFVEDSESCEQRTSQPVDQADLIIIFESGFVPSKEEVSLPIYAHDGKLLTIAFPVYSNFDEWQPPLQINFNQHQKFFTAPLTDVQALAARALKEKRKVLIARQVARAFAKSELHYKTEAATGVIGSVIASVYNVISERADLRSWLTLPGQVQLARLRVPVGKLRVGFNSGRQGSLYHQGILSSHLDLELTLAVGGTTIVQLTQVEEQWYHRVVQYTLRK